MKTGATFEMKFVWKNLIIESSACGANENGRSIATQIILELTSIMRSLMTIVMAVSMTTQCFASTGGGRRESVNLTLKFNLFLKSISTHDQLFFLAALAGTSTAAIRSVRQDLIARTSARHMPGIEIRKNEFFADNRPTGLFLESIAPIKVRYHGRTWRYDGRNSFDQNYFKLTNLFSNSYQDFTLLSLVLPTAQAEVSARDAFKNGLKWSILGGVAGAAIGAAIVGACMLFPEFTLATLVVTKGASWVVQGAAVAGMVLGKWYSIAHDTLDSTPNAGAILSAPSAWACDETGVTITFGNALNYKRQVFASRHPRSVDETLIELDKDGKKNPISILQVDARKQIAENLLSCKSEDDARRMASATQGAAQTTMALIAQPVPVKTESSAPKSVN
jgi:hypothetical protein